MGRICYRFVDAPYDRNWFIGLGNKVYEDWAEIRHRISESSGTQPSRKVTTFELFRDIIYGNNRRPELVDFRKYAIVESSKYQNIPRTIQNVFLNTKLDADFIKDTIIKSMTDDNISIDLDYFRNQIRDLRMSTMTSTSGSRKRLTARTEKQFRLEMSWGNTTLSYTHGSISVSFVRNWIMR